ncbi:origin recognition complex subunit 2-domain-containing protein [Catenaria anguillulae PL171]|uniref:Origin recognition complex subunit 2 n=1 Tax=Catenaria anguillulae PL171 TaxID=765915 RepID=A0A1Y2I0G8_9FUNG|nr:origin recognition complex subunit 2-domain-containing protein [Catenaria anguillulae PL171]
MKPTPSSLETTPGRQSRSRPRIATPAAAAATDSVITPRNENAEPPSSSTPLSAKPSSSLVQGPMSAHSSSSDELVDPEALKSVRRIVATSLAGPKRMSPSTSPSTAARSGSAALTSATLDMSLVSSDTLNRASRPPREGADDEEGGQVPVQPVMPGDGFARNRSGKVARNKMLALAGVSTEVGLSRTSKRSREDESDHEEEAEEEEDRDQEEEEDGRRTTRSRRQRRRLNEPESIGLPKSKSSASATTSRLLSRAMDAEATAASSSAEKDQADIDRFFEAHASLGATSDNTLASLPTLAHREYLEAVANLDAEPASTSCDPHVPSRQALMDVHRRCFAQWRFELSQGFNVLLVGFGSKHDVLSEFVSDLSDTHDVVLVHGYHPLASAKSILNTLSSTLECESTPVGLAEHTASILASLSLPTSPYTAVSPLVLAIHSIDAPGLRGEKPTSVLSSLAAHPSVSLVASADHMNAPLQWDYTTVAKLCLVTHHVATFARYTHETAFENALMVKPGATTPLAVMTVLSSLPKNSRACFGVLAREVIAQVKDLAANGGGGGMADKAVAAAGLPYTRLYARCREQFLVNEETSFRTIMTEFKDHQVVTSRRVDGIEVVGVSLPVAGIEKVLEEMEALG